MIPRTAEDIPKKADEARAAGREISRARALGVYYTPPRLAGLLSAWALEHDPKRILEPSFGQGVFLREAEAKLREHGVRNPARRLFGVELNKEAPAQLRAGGLRLPEGHLISGDLLGLDPGVLGGAFDAIIGNPPYIRHHLLDAELIERGQRAASKLGISLNGRSDAWTYFCAHLVGFLAQGGRLALVLPGSAVQADYAKPLLSALAEEKGEVQLIRIGERLFPGVAERTVLLLIDRSRPSGSPVIHRRISKLKGLGSALKRHPRKRTDKGGRRTSWQLSGPEEAVWERVCATEGVERLGELAKVRIGVVTGANSFFIRSEAEASGLGRRVDSIPIVTRGAWLQAPRWTRSDQRRVREEPSRLLIFPASEACLSQAAEEALKTARKTGLDKRYHCAKRDPWFRIEDDGVPMLFLPYMGSYPPALVKNTAEATCTNAIHRVWLKSDAGVSAEQLVAASHTTLYRLSAELVGRSYGGGVLKLEPSGAAALRMALPTKESLTLGELAKALRDGGREAARRLADGRLLRLGLEISKEDLAILGRAVERLERQRRA